MYGSGVPMAASHWPSMMCRSVRQTPAPPTFTITSRGPLIFGSGTSSITGWVWNLCNRTAFMGGPPRPASRLCQFVVQERLSVRVGSCFSLSGGIAVPVREHAPADSPICLDAYPGGLGLTQVQRYRRGRHAIPGHRIDQQRGVVARGEGGVAPPLAQPGPPRRPRSRSRARDGRTWPRVIPRVLPGPVPADSNGLRGWAVPAIAA